MNLPLEGIRILDLSRMLPGPYCSMILADLGAEVIHINNPRYPYANPPPFYQKGRYRESAFNSILMRNKKSISLNLKNEQAKRIFYELVKKADIVLETFRPKVTAKLKIDYDTLFKINKSLIYCSLTGYGQNGPYEQIAGHDMNYVGLCGILDLNREGAPLENDGSKPKPIVPGIQAADIGGALVATIGILGAIIGRNCDSQRKGQYIDVSMLDSVFSFMPMAAAINFSKNLNDGILNENILHGSVPYYSIYETKDHKYVSVGAIELKFWHALCEGLEREDLKNKQTVKGEEREYVFNELKNEFIKRTQSECIEIFKGLDACVMPIRSFNEACTDPQIIAREMVVSFEHPIFGHVPNIASPIKYSHTPLSIRSLAPKLGEHTIEILRDLNYSDEEIREFKKAKII
ncbi:MAG: CaiB/BaiF CoA-transferase family protein [Candidatus Lokiarchaeota archaeon]|jgi:crotonobetainyl-CoA:carnitine CoA-transferase CaiB-like acyl-CoA transferase